MLKYGEWLDCWLEIKKKRTKIATYTVYVTQIEKQIKPRLGNFPVEKITEKNIQNTIDYWKKEGNLANNNGLSPKSISCLVSIVKTSIYAYYKTEGKAAPTFDLVMPVMRKTRMLDVLDTEEQRKLVKAIFKNITPLNASIAFGLMGGLRVGEVCAIQWRDINLEKKTISISQTVQRIYDKKNEQTRSYVVIDSPKTPTSIRQVPISPTLQNILLVLKPENKDCDDIYVVTGRRTPTEPRSVNTHFKLILSRLGMSARPFHCLRHSFATRWISCGLDVKNLSQILGHSSVETTYDTYVHPTMEDLHKEVLHFENLWLL